MNFEKTFSNNFKIKRCEKNCSALSRVFNIHIFIDIFGFSMKNAFKWVQTGLEWVQWFLRQLAPWILRKHFKFNFFYPNTEASTQRIKNKVRFCGVLTLSILSPISAIALSWLCGKAFWCRKYMKDLKLVRATEKYSMPQKELSPMIFFSTEQNLIVEKLSRKQNDKKLCFLFCFVFVWSFQPQKIPVSIVQIK